MFTIRNLGGTALFLFGTTFVWLTPEFASKGLSTSGAWWPAARLLSLATVAGFSVATWGLFGRAGWWEVAAVGSALLGLVALVPYWVAAERAGEVTPGFNVLIHALGSAAVLLLLWAPGLERWVDAHVMGR